MDRQSGGKAPHGLRQLRRETRSVSTRPRQRDFELGVGLVDQPGGGWVLAGGPAHQRHVGGVLRVSGNSDCMNEGNGLVCRDGECTEVTCMGWSDCEQGEACQEGRCVIAQCSANYDCDDEGEGLVCREGLCLSTACETWTDCEAA